MPGLANSREATPIKEADYLSKIVEGYGIELGQISPQYRAPCQYLSGRGVGVSLAGFPDTHNSLAVSDVFAGVTLNQQEIGSQSGCG